MIFPDDEKQLAEAIATSKNPLQIFGGGTRQGLGHAVTGDALHVGNLSGISVYEPGALTIVAQAGTPVAEIEKVLAGERQRLAFEPMEHSYIYGSDGASTIGGIVACNISGPRRIQAGACRDYLLGVRFIDGQGTVLKNGGRVMKNVTGYDLVKLMAGSYGTLGVLSEMSFKVLPEPETVATIRVAGLTDEVARQAMSDALTSPFDVTGAAHFPGAEAETYIRLEGFEGSVRYRAEKLKEQLAVFGEVSVISDPAQSEEIWTKIRNVEGLPTDGDLWRISVKPTDGPEVAMLIGAQDYYFDWGGGLIWASVPKGRDVRARLSAISGHATLVRAANDVKESFGVFTSETPVLARINAGLRMKFDPKNILNRGKMGSDSGGNDRAGAGAQDFT